MVLSKKWGSSSSEGVTLRDKGFFLKVRPLFRRQGSVGVMYAKSSFGRIDINPNNR
jgi:hypothetical protein